MSHSILWSIRSRNSVVHKSCEEQRKRTLSVQRKSVELANGFCIVFRVYPELHLDNCTKNDSKIRPVAKRSIGKGHSTGVTDNILNVTNNWSQDESDEKIKLIRAQGGCPGTIRRRRSWQAAKSYGEPQAGIDP